MDIIRELKQQFDHINTLITNLVSQNLVDNNLDIIKFENDYLDKIKSKADKLKIDVSIADSIFKEVINYFKKRNNFIKDSEAKANNFQKQIKVAFQGIEGAYSHLAGKKYFSDGEEEVLFIGLPSFQVVIESVENGESDYGILPIENTTAGSINESYDLLIDTKLFITGEEIYDINHCLIAISEVSPGRIKRIFSHPQALAQCSIFLSTLENCRIESYFDTAMAIKKIKEDQDISQAAIGSIEAAALYGLEVIKENIANSKENYTRFFIISKKQISYQENIPCKISLAFATKHVEGALVHCLNILANHHLNLTKIQSRPRPNVPWEYLFYIDFEGNLNNPNVREALNEFTAEVSYLKILGCYPLKTVKGFSKSESNLVEEGKEIEISNVDIPKISLKTIEKKSYKLASRYYKEQDSQIRIKDVIIGGKDFIVIAGPCSVESEEQVFQSAKIISEQKGDILRGGVFKPRTSPYSFQGLGYSGLKLLSAAGRKYDLPIITEVLNTEDVQKIAMVADILQIGARNMQNFPLLTEVGRINKPVLLKRGMMASIDEFLSAAEYILSQGNQQVILCERGIRTFETATRNTLDLSAVPILKYYSHLPIIVDPSHAVGNWKWIIPMVEASYAAGAHGVMVEIHPEPEKALSDGEQSLNFNNFKIMMQRINRLRQIL